MSRAKRIEQARDEGASRSEEWRSRRRKRREGIRPRIITIPAFLVTLGILAWLNLRGGIQYDGLSGRSGTTYWGWPGPVWPRETVTFISAGDRNEDIEDRAFAVTGKAIPEMFHEPDRIMRNNIILNLIILFAVPLACNLTMRLWAGGRRRYNPDPPQATPPAFAEASADRATDAEKH